MRAKWRKIIWAILAVQLLSAHFLFLEKMLRDFWQLDYLIGRAVDRFGFPPVLYGNWRSAAVFVWLLSAAFIMSVHYLNYARFRRDCIGRLRMISDESVKRSLREAAQETGLYDIEKEGTERSFLYGSRETREPFVIGFREPILILPEKEYGGRGLPFIFLHECYHIKHKDTIYKLFMLLIQSLLWFQPLMYLLKAAAFQDVETACDEAVVEGRDISERKEYAAALLQCLEQERMAGQVYSAYFYHGKRMMKARISAIMNENKKWDFLAYAVIAVLLSEAVFTAYRIGDRVYQGMRIRREQAQAEIYGYDENGAPKSSVYDGYELPESFSQAAVDEMTKLEPLPEDAYYREFQGKDDYEEKEFDELPYAAEGPWQIRLKDADRYGEAIPLLLQRYLSYYTDQEWAAQWNPEEYGNTQLDIVSWRLLAGDKDEAVFAVIFRYYIGYEKETLMQFPEEFRGKSQAARENDGYYAYFNWAVKIRMVQDYVFELEGIAETKEVLEAYIRQAEQPVKEMLGDVPEIDLANGTGESEINGLFEGTLSENAYRVDTKEGILRVSGADGVWKEVPVTLEELYGRGDEMDGKQTSLQAGSYQVDEKKIVFAYGGSNTVPFSVVFYEEESRSFKKSVVTYDYFGGRKIYVDFPENGQEGFLVFTGERVVWQETTILFHTTDGGKSWQYVGPAGPDAMTEGHSLTTGAVFINNRVGFLTIRDSETPDIWRTEDGGKTWERQNLPEVPDYYCMAYAPEERDGVLCLYVGMEEYSEYGGSKAKYESRDEGKTWEYRGIVVRQ